ncbi:MAG TPA: M1 family peptidase, partial [Pseudomonadota bacterium]|nr:M1 family peptidase [Pseudomonadota bacterium]
MSVRAFRLPTHVRPLSYHIDLSTDPSRVEFAGTVTVELEITAQTETIILHARHLEVTRAEISAMFGETDSALITYQPEQETVTLLLGRPLPVGRAR